MVDFTEEEKEFLKRAIVKTQPYFDDNAIDPTKKEDIIVVLSTYRAKGLMPGRRFDGGKEYDMWHLVRNKLGVPSKTREEILKEHEEKRMQGLLERVTESHNARIMAIERQLQAAQKAKLEAQGEVEKKLREELEALEKKKKEAIERLELAQSARRKLKIDKEIDKLEKERKEMLETKDGMRKCWGCGDWYKVAGGVWTKHVKECVKE